jgi:Flp pilus assembly protein TadB
MNLEEFLEKYKEYPIGAKEFYEQYLRDTDYIIIKMYEKAIQGGNIIELLKECKETLSKREEARAQINELSQESMTE